ncbi:TRAP-type C4-dicarboxylate transport system, small permease component [Desulfuromonas soudanensis]|jgi:TRAP-type C4-dicarboxylate transport system permease small subunit|uniref:TRAP-type C4-dicarboxylate transport system, small permease component n=1 Tax=Desulfuromonas soudanensis TaxID=1603606 RepID=A0A0M4D714_9BACT|nr:TRAP transporter small permease [Desulfuromonas soudanensis]ALC15192.1 TRAP-type C4-dicarboxylate transport system, small permease component [Desulfuromonas soudanensis]
MKTCWRGFSRAVGQVNTLMGYLSAVMIIICTMALTYEVVVRYFFNAPTSWSLEFNIFMLVASTFLAAAYTQIKRGHVGIGMLDSIMSARWNRWRYLVADLASLIFCSFVSYYTWKFFYMVWDQGWVTESPWAPKLWIPYFFMAFGLTSLSVQCLIQIIDEHLVSLEKGE